MMLIAQYRDTTWVHHQMNREGDLEAKPPLCEGPCDVPMSYKNNIFRLGILHVLGLQVFDFGY